MAQVDEALCYKTEDHGLASLWILQICHWFNPSGRTMILGSTQSLTDQPRGLVVSASGYKSRGLGFDSRLYHGDFPCGGRIPVVTMVWVVSRIRFKVETSLTRSYTSINSWLNSRQRSPRWRGPHHERQPAHQLIEYPRTLLITGGKKMSVTAFRSQSIEHRSYIRATTGLWRRGTSRLRPNGCRE